MSFWTFANLADVTKGTWLVESDDPSAEAAGLWHDTRELQPGKAYLAIKGENFDGHDFIDKAFEAGAALAIVQAEPPSLEGGAGGRVASQPVLLVDDTVKALQDLARAYRDVLKQGGCKVIGIAGSNGKTTTRHLIHHVLTHAGLTGTQSPKSFNNHLGVPLTLLQAKPSDDFVACEIGTNHPGEIDFLSAIVRPDIAVITSIGEEHLEFFHDLEGVAQEELSIIEHIIESGPVVIANSCLQQSDISSKVKASVKGRRFDTPNVEIRKDMPQYIGSHNESNGSLAVGVAQWMGIDQIHAKQALCSAAPPQHRMVRNVFGYDVVLIDDCYNANPSSMVAAFGALYQEAKGRSVAIVGDMYELGDQSESAHHMVGGFTPIKGEVDHVFIFVGPMMAEHAPKGIGEVGQPAPYHSFSEFTDRTPGDVADLLQPGDTVLLKASRGMRLERLIPAIERRFGPATDEKPT